MKRVFVFLMSSVACSAWSNLIVNGSFENGGFVPNGQNTMSLGVGSTAMTGWTVYNDTIAWIADPNPFGVFASDGIKALDLADYAIGGPYGGVRQSFASTPGRRYRVSFDLGTHPSWTSSAAIEVSAAGSSQTFTSVSGSGQRWDSYSWEFSATSTSTTLVLLGTYQTFTYIGLDNVVVTDVGSLLHGHVDLGDFTGDPSGRIVEVDLTNLGTSFTGTATLDSNGDFDLSATVPDGLYVVGIKASHWLRKAVPGVSVTSAGPNSVSVVITNGDVNHDNEVSVGDYGILSSAFNSFPGDPNWFAEADLNGDDSVDVGDYSILSAHFGDFGD